MNEETKARIYGILKVVFMAGQWRGQVDLEENMDNDFYSVFQEYLSARKTCIPSFPASTGKTVIYNLRSDEWKEGVKKETQKWFDEQEIKLIKLFEDEVGA